MRKQRSDDTLKLIIAAIISSIVFGGMIIIWYNNLFLVYTENHILFSLEFIYVLIIIMLTLSSFGVLFGVPVLLIVIKIHNYMEKKSYKKNLQEMQKKLSSEFSEVRLKNLEKSTLIEGVDNKEIKCMAKLDENGKVILKFQIETDDYEWVLNHFDV